jgi:hypothetical protein
MLFSGCLQKSRIDIVLSSKNKLSVLNANLANVQIINHQIILTGTNFNNVTDFKIKNGSTTTNLQIESKSDTSIIANTLSNVNFAIGTIFDFVLSNANGATAFQVAFTNTNNSITASMLTSMGATKGQIMKYNGSTWVPSSITNAQTYLGTYDATANNPDLASPSVTPGDYYIVSVAGSLNSIPYLVGDWIISDGYNWQKVANSAVVVSTYNGRRGMVTTTPSDYILLKNGSGKLTGSSIDNLADVNIVTPLNGSVLKYDSATNKWIVGIDNSGAGVYTGTINKAVITDGTTGALTTASTSAAELNFVTGVSSSIQTQLNAKEPLITAGAATKYFRGDKTFVDLATDVRGSTLTGLSSTAGSIVTGDTVLEAFGKILNTQSDYVSKSANSTITGTLTINSIVGALTVPSPINPSDAVNKNYVDSFGQWGTNSGNVYRTTGSVGIGTSSPNSNLKLQINGAAASAVNIINSGGVIDLSLSNVHYLKSVGGSTISLSNMASGGSYTIIVYDLSQQTYAFTGCTNSYFSPANGQTYQYSSYSIMAVVDGANTNCFINWVTGFN